MNQSQRILLKAIRAALFGTKPSFPDDTNWDEVVKEAKAQTVLGIISPVIPIHDESVEQGKANYMRILYEQDKLIRLFDENNIPCVVIKGSAAAIYYPKPYLRAMGDVDILVPRNKFHKAAKLMEENGYVCFNGKEDNGDFSESTRHIEYKMNGIEFELHHHFSSPGFDMDDILEKAISKRVYGELNGYKFPMLPNIENGLVLLGHINYHLNYNNLGLRQIIDWEMYIASEHRSKNLYRFSAVAKRLGLFPLAANITGLCEMYLGLSYNPYRIKRRELTDELIEVTFSNGNFGRKILLSPNKYVGRVRNSVYNIKKNGLFDFFQSVGLAKWELAKKYPALKPLAFIYGGLFCLYKGIISLYRNGNVNKQIKEGQNRFRLYKKIGVKNGKEKTKYNNYKH